MLEVKKTQTSREHLPWSVWDHLRRRDTTTNPFPLLSTDATPKGAAPGETWGWQAAWGLCL